MHSEPTPSVKVFYCYAREDKLLRDELEKYLGNLRRQNHITSWSDYEINGGKEWTEEIDLKLNAADIILILISPSFMHLEYYYEAEMKRAMQRLNTKDSYVIDIILHPINWEDALISKLQILPDGEKPITIRLNRDEAFYDIARGIGKVINETLKEQWLKESRNFRITNKFEEALTAIEKAISLDPKYIQAYVEKGIIYRDRPFELTDADISDFDFGSKRVSDEVIALFEKAIQLDPTYAQAYFEIAVTYARNAYYTEALITIEKVIQLDPTYAQAYLEKGIIYRKKPCKPFEWTDDYIGDYDETIALANFNEAIASFEKVIQLDPTYAQAYYEMATTYYNKKEYQKALVSIDKFIELGPSNSTTYLRRGLCLNKLERLVEAIGAYEIAIQLDPDNADAYVAIGDTFYALERLEEALQNYKKFVQLNPYQNLVYRKMGKIYETFAKRAYYDADNRGVSWLYDEFY